MRTMKCNQLGGACEKKFRANTFEEIAKQSQEHGKEMFSIGDEAHLEAMKKMHSLMSKPEDMNNWMEARKKEFYALPED